MSSSFKPEQQMVPGSRALAGGVYNMVGTVKSLFCVASTALFEGRRCERTLSCLPWRSWSRVSSSPARSWRPASLVDERQAVKGLSQLLMAILKTTCRAGEGGRYSQAADIVRPWMQDVSPSVRGSVSSRCGVAFFLRTHVNHAGHGLQSQLRARE